MVPVLGERFADRARDRRDQVGRGDDGRETQEARQLELHAALDALALQRTLQHRIAGRRQDPDVRLVLVRPRREVRADARVLRADEADEVLRVEPLLVKSGLEPRDIAEGKIGLAGFQQVCGVCGDGRDVQANRGRNGADMGEQPRQQRDVARIGHADPEGALRAAGIERRLAAGQAPQQRQRFARRADERVGARGGLHAGRRAHEQRVVPMPAQLGEPDAGGRLAQGEPLRRAGHALGAVDLVEQHEHPGVTGNGVEGGVHD